MSDLSRSITWVKLHSELLSLLPQPSHKVSQPDDVVAMIPHGQAYRQHNKSCHCGQVTKDYAGVLSTKLTTCSKPLRLDVPTDI